MTQGLEMDENEAQVATHRVLAWIAGTAATVAGALIVMGVAAVFGMNSAQTTMVTQMANVTIILTDMNNQVRDLSKRMSQIERVQDSLSMRIDHVGGALQDHKNATEPRK